MPKSPPSLAQTGFFLAMVSPKYNASTYCRHKELAEFLRRHPPDSGRLIQIHLDSAAALPVDKSLAVPFINARGPFRPDSADYQDALRRVYEPIACELDKLYADSKMVFLAWPGDPSLEEERRRLEAEIEGRGLRIYPEAVAEYESDVRLRDALQHCMTSVHFFGEEATGFDVRQWEEAVRVGKPCVLASRSVTEARRGPAGSPPPIYLDQGNPTISMAKAIASEGSDRLPLLQHLLMILWEGRQSDGEGSSAITLEQYEAARSAADALNDHADRVWNELTPHRQQVASAVFRALTGGGAGRDLRRPLRLSQLAAETGAPRDVRAVAEHFYAADFLRSPDRGLTADWEADITHESLIRQWRRLAGWVAEEAKDADDYRYYSLNATREASPLLGRSLESAVQWVDKGHNAVWAGRYGGDYAATVQYIRRSEELGQREEARKERTRHWMFVSAAASIVVTLALVALTFYLWREHVAGQTARARSAELDGAKRIEGKRPDQAAACFARALRSAALSG